MMQCLFVGLGGFIGCICRYLVSTIPLLKAFPYPIATLLINMAGSFVIAMITELSTKLFIHPNILLLLQIGLCGGFTSFSTFSLEAVRLLEQGKIMIGLSYMLLSCLLCILCFYLGKLIIKSVF